MSLHTGRRKVEDEGESPSIEAKKSKNPADSENTTKEPEIYVASTSPDPTLNNLPWPESEELTAVPEAEPATTARTGADLHGNKKIRPDLSKKTAVLNLSSTLPTTDSLGAFLVKYCLGLRTRDPIL